MRKKSLRETLNGFRQSHRIELCKVLCQLVHRYEAVVSMRSPVPKNIACQDL